MSKFLKCVFAMMFLIALAVTTGCTVSKTRASGESTEASNYDQAYQNLSDQYDAQEQANAVNHTKRMDLELKVDLQSLAIQAKIDPIAWTPAAISAETARLQALHDSKIAAYAASQAQFRALKTKNEATNIAGAHKIRDALNPPVPTVPVNLTTQIQGASGTAPAAPLFQP